MKKNLLPLTNSSLKNAFLIIALLDNLNRTRFIK